MDKKICCHNFFVSVSCNHMRAVTYFTQAISNPSSIIAVKCEYRMMIFSVITEKVALGDLTTKKTGNFYFETNKNGSHSKCGKTFVSNGMEKMLSILPGVN